MEIDEIIERQALSDANRERVRLLEEAFARLDALPPRGARMDAYAVLAAELSGKLPAISRKEKSLSAKTLMRLYADYRKRGWRALVVAYARKSDYITLPGAFLQFWKQLYLDFKVDGSGKQAHRALLDRLAAWRAGDAQSAIPGFGAPPQNQLGKEYPAGWSLPNLMRHRPPKMLTALVKKGRSEAKGEYGPLVRRTRRDLEPGEVIMFDDVWQDHDVMYPGSATVVRPLGLVALDVASGKQISWGMRPRLRNEAGTHTALKAFDMEMIVADVLCRFGVHPNGTTFVLENGTANVSRKTAEFLKARFNVDVIRSGVDRMPAFLGAISGDFKGNSRFKAALESHHNLMHNALSFLPGYTGKNRTPPEPTQGMKRAYAALIRQATKDGLPESVRNKLGVGHVDWMTFFEVYGAVLERVNARTDHDLEGWEKHLVTEARFSENMPWGEFNSEMFPPAVAEAILANPLTHRVRQLSPSEVWARGAGKLRRVSFAAMGELFCQPDKTDKAKTLDARALKSVSSRHEFEIAPTADDPHEYIFSAEITTPDRRRIILEPGEKYKVLLNPFSGADELCVYGLDGAYLGSSFAKRERVPYTEDASLFPQLGAATKGFARLAHPANTLTQNIQEQTKLAAQNNAIALAAYREEQRAAEGASNAARERALERDDLAITQHLDIPALPAAQESAEDDYSEPTF